MYHAIDIAAISVYDRPSMPRGEYAPRSGEGEREDRLQTALQSLEQGIDSIRTSESFAAYLTTMARFHSYSSSNVALILLQRPDATRVAGYKKWQELGRQVKKGEKGIAILVPHTRRFRREPDESEERGEDEPQRGSTTVSSFGVGSVFDGLSRDLGRP